MRPWIFLLYLALFATKVLALDLKNPLTQGGWFNQNAVLRIVEPYGFVLGSGGGLSTYLIRYQSVSPLKEWSFNIQYFGAIGIRVESSGNDPWTSTIHSADKVREKTLSIQLKSAVHHIEVQFEIADEDSFLIGAKPAFSEVTTEDIVSYKDAGPWNIDNSHIRFSIPLGVNLEAEYVFRESGPIQRQMLLKQIKKDGFNSIRLHKLMDACQAPRFSGCSPSFLRGVERFLQDAVEMGFVLSLDVLSNPEDGGFYEGWKGEIFLNKGLQDRLREWIFTLNTLKINGSSLWSHPALKQVVLFNENSLFYETAPEVKALLWKSYLQEIKNAPYVSLRAYAESRMLDFGFELERILKDLGYRGNIFFSNYQAAGKDLDLNHFFGNGLVDRHLYVDYPRFSQGAVKVRNVSPVLKHKQLFEEYRALTRYGPIFISEFNLPWPNRYQHELIPLLLSLYAIEPLRGVWFYDYRLRTKQFHSGGIFGVQKFRSIIGQLPWLAKALEHPLNLTKEAEALIVKAGPYTMKSGFFKENPLAYSITCWQEGHVFKECFSFEKAAGDVFDRMGTMQFQFGEKAFKADVAEASFSF
ncbi:MAG: hypothetical protein H3C47_05625 [Candidatus Cloacimonetes bacterium]|nr:hypothetical protein [Candidatus Cloacimonadota bacterium]